MARWSGNLLVGCALAASLLAPKASAADGRITFSGKILAPTCAVTLQDAMAAVAGDGADTARACAMPGVATEDTRNYTLSVSELARLTMDNRLRRYFADFVAVDSAPARTRLVVRTYE